MAEPTLTLTSLSALVASALEHFESHFAPYLRCFESRTRSVEKAARQYLHGLFQSSRRNMECMAETVAESDYQQLHHMLSESEWEQRHVRRQLVADANAHFGYRSGLSIDESGLAKKGVSFRQDGMKSLNVLGKVGCEFNPMRSSRWTTWRRWRQQGTARALNR
jgi:hypothetical protein